MTQDPAVPVGGGADTSGGWVVLQARELVTDWVVLESRFWATDVDRLFQEMAEISGLPPGHDGYIIGDVELVFLDSRFGVLFATCQDWELTLNRWHHIREAPYLIHTGYEIQLMVERRKPLSVFSDGYPCSWLDRISEVASKWVALGHLVLRTYDNPFERPRPTRDGSFLDGIRTVYLSLPDHEWRIDAHRLLIEIGRRDGWSEGLERFEGQLLGYEDWQNDWWIRYRFRK